MSFLSHLMDVAAADTDVLRSLDETGDDFSRFREVDFLILAPSTEKAEAICGFLNDYRYGNASIVEEKGPHNIRVVIRMPVEQSIILCVSGFMTCVAYLFGATLDGWGCAAVRA